ncbi:enoyl-CoA hydratase/isomerase family protein [Myxococcota bacterium]|nr:enoyl-CoA hydratase/isomerase family protein [Myxococcota bacterium]
MTRTPIGAAHHLCFEQYERVRYITLDRPDKLNAITPEMEDQFHSSVDEALGDEGVGVIVISGRGRAFSSGADLAAGQRTDKSNDGPEPWPDTHDAGSDLQNNRGRVERWLKLWSAPKPTIAQVHGYCLGMANELVACCDLVVCGESARFGMPEARQFGLPPTLALWPARIGLQRTKEMLFTGRLMDAAEAEAVGIANAVVPDAELTDHVDALAREIAQSDPQRLAVCKAAANAWYEETGALTAARRGAEFHALYHQFSEWGNLDPTEPRSEES